MLSFAKRGIAAAGLAAALMGTLAAPAFAAQDAELSLFANDVLLAPGSDGQHISPILLSNEPIELTNAKLKVDFSELADFASVESDESQCVTAGKVMTCDLGALSVDFMAFLPGLTAKPLADAKLDASGEVRFTLSGDGGPDVTETVEVIIAEGVDIAASTEQKINAAPGAGFGAPLAVGNTGKAVINGTAVLFYNGYGVNAGEKRYSNCFYADDEIRACVFEEDLAVGTDYVTAEALSLKLRADAEAPGVQTVQQIWQTEAEWALTVKMLQKVGGLDSLGTPGDDDPLHLVKVDAKKGAQTDINLENNFGLLLVNVTGNNPFDFAAIGGSGVGKVNDVVELNLGMKNLGPAARDSGTSGDNVAKVLVTLPQGTSLTEMPDGCSARAEDGDDLSAKVFVCWVGSYVGPGEKREYSFKLRIDKVVADATGSVKLRTGNSDQESPDKNTYNNDAAIVINGSSLPTTGDRTGLIAVTGVALLAAGAVVFVLARRRRVTAAE